MGVDISQQDFVYKLLSKEEKVKNGIKQETIVALVDYILYNAIKLFASDIHLEQNQNHMRVRYRIDGILYDQKSIEFNERLSVLSRLKILSSLDIAQKRIPQDGKFRVSINYNECDEDNINLIDLRVSTFPSIYGEKMVVRILDQAQNCIKLNSLGFNSKILNKVFNLIQKPHGFFLVTGPTGSGKTTTLYAIISELNDSIRNIVTMEDPVEYNLEGITQSQINPKAGFTFERGLRSILRQDPDVVMVGEVRDKQTAQISIEAALTGHLVLSTLHTNDSAGVITRLIDMGIEPFLINGSISGILAQRLVRKLCKHCREPVELSLSEQKNLKDKNLIKNEDELKTVFKAKGCDYCFNLGYRGRTGIFELLIMNNNVRDLIMQKTSTEKILYQAIKDGMTVLFDDGLQKVKEGIISIEELLRVVSE